MTTDVKLHSLTFDNARTYLFAMLFAAGNILLPQLCHFIPNGGNILLPIYFFTLIAAYKYGIRVGLLTAILSPLVNFMLFEMPAATMLPVVLFKSVTIATAAALVARHFNRRTLLALAVAVLMSQVLGAAFQWLYSGSFGVAVEAVSIGIPGMLLQVLGGYLALKATAKL